MSQTPVNKKKGTKAQNIETFPAPSLDIELYKNFVHDCALKNDFQTICGAYDAKEHPLALYITNENLFNKRDDLCKTPLDMAACVGSFEFLKALLERVEKLTPELLDFKNTNSNGYNCLHYACVWGRANICKVLIFNSGTVGSLLLKSKTVYNETPKDLAKRYNHANIVEFLNFAGKSFTILIISCCKKIYLKELRQQLIDKINKLKEISDDPEKNLGKLNKDDKV